MCLPFFIFYHLTLELSCRAFGLAAKATALLAVNLSDLLGNYLLLFFFANNCVAGQPISLCLQNLHETELLIKPVTGNAIMLSTITNDNIVHEKFLNKLTIPIAIGTIETRKSGNMSSHVIFLDKNRSGVPFLKKIEQILPLPNAQFFP